MIDLLLISIFCYFLGSLPFSFLIAKAYGKNLFQVGSGNVGTANVWRATKKIEAAILALIGDTGKGFFAIFLAEKFFPQKPLFQILASFFVVFGHNWSIFLKFRGGRGLATLAGILLYLNWKALLFSLFLLGFCIFLVEIFTKRKFEIKALISQVLGRVIGIFFCAVFLYLFFPKTFKIIFPSAILVGIKHIKRTKTFLEGKVV